MRARLQVQHRRDPLSIRAIQHGGGRCAQVQRVLREYDASGLALRSPAWHQETSNRDEARQDAIREGHDVEVPAHVGPDRTEREGHRVNQTENAKEIHI